MGTLRQDIQDLWIAIKETGIDYVQSTIDTLKETWPVLLVLVVILGTGIRFSNPPPPKNVVMTTSYPGSSLDKIGQAYAKFLGDKGIHLELHNTADSGDNLRHILDPHDPTQVAFVPTILVKPDQVHGIVSLGAIGSFPVLAFTHGFTPRTISDLIGKRIYVGPEGSGNYAVSLKLLSLIGIANQVTLVKEPLDHMIETIEAGKVDVVITVDELDSKNLLYLANNPNWQLESSGTSEAISRLLPEFKKSTMPKSGLNFLDNKPAESVDILTANVELVAKESLHPAIQMLLLQATKEINSKQSLFADAGEFPGFKNSPIPESPEAKLFYEKGKPFLMNYLPFWLAEMIYRLFYLLIPFIIFVYPFIKMLPDLKLKPTKKRFSRIYTQLRQIEERFLESSSLEDIDGYLLQVADLENQVKSLHIPPKLSSDYFSLRSTIDFFSATLLKARDVQATQTPNGIPPA